MLSVSFTVASFLLLAYILAKHFRGMRVPPYWIFFIFGFVLLSVHGVYVTLDAGPDVKLAIPWIKLLASLSILIGSYDIFRTYTMSVSERLVKLQPTTTGRKTKKRARRRR